MIALPARLAVSPFRYLAGWAGLLIATLWVAWACGFALFLHEARQPINLPAHADGIVALTGGADRIETALRLLVEGRARVLLVSGTGGGAEFAELAHRAGLDPAPWESRVTLGRKATSTRGNAAETADWARDNGVRSLMVVTAGYHMPRALTELERVLPGVALYPVPVIPRPLNDTAVLLDTGMLRLMAQEYTKWLVARLGLSAFGPRHVSPAPAPVTRSSRGAPRPGQDHAG
jgi:uncharacterized SAM-binding protein YcdF (DUF218 family)